jgi:hypothetical protein
MVKKSKNTGNTKKERVKVGKLKSNQEMAKDLSATEKSKVKGGAVNAFLTFYDKADGESIQKR